MLQLRSVQTGQVQVQRSNNGFVNASATSIQGANNVSVPTFAYASGPFGRWYQSGTAFVNAGSRTAAAAGLYHHTTQADQAKEGATQVDIGLHYPATRVVTPTVSGQQGANGWYYRYCSVLGGPPDNDIPVWDGQVWRGAGFATYSDYYTIIAQNFMHPGQTRDTALVYRLPVSGRVFVNADLSDGHDCGTDPALDGVWFRAAYDGIPTTPWAVVAEHQQHMSYTTSISGTAGHDLGFILNRGPNSNGCDSTFVYLTLAFQDVRDTDGDGVPDYLEDRNGNGVVDSGETSWNSATDLGLKVWITEPKPGMNLP